MANLSELDAQIGRIDPPRPARAGGGTAATLTPPAAELQTPDIDMRVSTRATAQSDRLEQAVDTVGRQLGRLVGYLRSRRSSDIRADAERTIVDSPGLALAAALGLGFVIGTQLRR